MPGTASVAPPARAETRCVKTEAAADLADFEALGLRDTRPVALLSPADGLLLTSRTERWLDTSATSLDCCLSQATLDGVKGRLTTKDLPLDVGEAIEPVAKLLLPELFEGVPMPFP
ncbi:MAG: hypothetical protein U1C74_28475 [Phenylobacterium sp.]|nr:hypothetical protein [Phenylobacterium sp.]